MAQGGSNKLKRAPRSAGSQKRKAVKAPSKGRKTKAARRPQAVQANKPLESMTKQINKKNESIVAAKAIASGSKFFLKDISERGSKEHTQQIKVRNKKQDRNSNSMTGRLRTQIEQLQQGTKLK